MADKIEARRQVIERKGRVRELVFGMQDGTISTVGLLAGMQGATDRTELVLLAGITSILSGALSMAAGAYLSARAEKDIVDHERREAEKLAGAEPYLAQEGVLRALETEGLSRADSYRVVRLLSGNHRVLLSTFSEKVFGLGAAELNQPVKGAVVMAASFVSGGTMPLLPYLLFEDTLAILASAATAALVLFGVGAFKGRLAGEPPMRSATLFFCVAVGATAVGYGIGLVAEMIAPGAARLAQ